MYIITKYREMLIRKFLEARRSNFESGTPTTAIDLKVLDLLSDAHRIALEKLMEQLKIHKLEWTRPSISSLFGADIQRGGILSRFHPSVKYWVRQLILIDGSWTVVEDTDRWICECSATTSSERTPLPQEPAVEILALICIFIEPPVGTYNLCRDLIVVGPFVDIETDPAECLGVFRRRPDANQNFSSSSSLRSANLSSSRSSASSGPQIDFTDDIPEIQSSDDIPQIEETTAVIPHISLPAAAVPSTCYIESFSQLRATVDKISTEQVQTRFHIDELKAALSKKISNLEIAFLTSSDNQDRVVHVQNDVLRKEMQVQKAALSKELDDIRKEMQDHKAAIAHDLLEFRVEAQEKFNTLSAHLFEIIAYINKGHCQASCSTQINTCGS
ncbi:hypothetical protein F511_15765 [Dorcoceras hygrometricum]|uniref:Uncharacterized protein n=1 Tax=Dorcoceras hygrometricum TaxID=472368 RepID=A0A2Z7CLY8_9LAMI|nr:hypothetical protein F511_15765 [Dorcoceras hygrometricum]